MRAQAPQAILCETPEIWSVVPIGLQERGIQEQPSAWAKHITRLLQYLPRIFAVLQNGGKDDRVKTLSSEMRREVMRVSYDIDARPRHDVEIDAIVADPNVLRADIKHVPEHHPVP